MKTPEELIEEYRAICEKLNAERDSHKKKLKKFQSKLIKIEEKFDSLVDSGEEELWELIDQLSDLRYGSAQLSGESGNLREFDMWESSWC